MLWYYKRFQILHIHTKVMILGSQNNRFAIIDLL
jgi:hypothetical protein